MHKQQKHTADPLTYTPNLVSMRVEHFKEGSMAASGFSHGR